jgi:hypothetical protein
MTKHRSEIQRLGFFEEAVGDLHELTLDQGFLIAGISKVNLVLPPEMESKLHPLIGMRVGVLHTDIAGKEWLVRVIPESGDKIALMTDDNISKIDISVQAVA